MKNAKDGARVLPAAVTVNEQQRLQPLNTQASLGKEGLAGFSLDRREAELPRSVEFQEESHPRAAKKALRVEDNNHSPSPRCNSR
jgi:hypothetical protein